MTENRTSYNILLENFEDEIKRRNENNRIEYEKRMKVKSSGITLDEMKNLAILEGKPSMYYASDCSICSNYDAYYYDESLPSNNRRVMPAHMCDDKYSLNNIHTHTHKFA